MISQQKKTYYQLPTRTNRDPNLKSVILAKITSYPVPSKFFFLLIVRTVFWKPQPPTENTDTINFEYRNHRGQGRRQGGRFVTTWGSREDNRIWTLPHTKNVNLARKT